MKYKYTVTDKNGKVIKGEMVARTQSEIEDNLLKYGYTVLSIELEKEKSEGTKKQSSLFQKKISLQEKILLFTNLAAMLKAGLPVVEAIDVLKEGQKNQRLIEILDVASYDIQGGMTFHSALSKFPEVFTTMDLSMFEVGEVGGLLEENIRTLAVELKNQKDLQSKVKGAMMYPMVITVALVAIVILLIIFVIPQIAGFFKDADLKLPLTTRLLIGLSDLLINYGLYVLAIVIAAIVGFRTIYKKSKNFKRLIDGLILKIPFVGVQIIKLNTARFTKTLSALLKSGVPIIRSLEITRNGFSNLIYQEALDGIAQDIEAGQELADAMAKFPDIFYSMAVRMVRVGGQTGTIDESLLNVSTYYQEEVTEVLDNLSSIIEPVLLLVMGGGVALIALSVLGPIYQLTGSIS